MSVIEKAIEHYGVTKQKVVAMEEMSELIKEVSKDIRGEGNIEHIAEEIADVEIMIMQLEKIYNISLDVIVAKMNDKLERLKGRITNEQIREDKHVSD